MSTALPARARVVIIGGGVIGASIAYHLAHLGITDVLVLERDRLTSGTTWHAAGLVTCFGSTSETNTRMRLYSRDLYARLEAETGVATGFKAVGVVEAAADALVPGGLVCVYVATTTQLSRVMETLRAHGGFAEPHAWESLVRD